MTAVEVGDTVVGEIGRWEQAPTLRDGAYRRGGSLCPPETVRRRVNGTSRAPSPTGRSVWVERDVGGAVPYRMVGVGKRDGRRWGKRDVEGAVPYGKFEGEETGWSVWEKRATNGRPYDEAEVTLGSLFEGAVERMRD